MCYLGCQYEYYKANDCYCNKPKGRPCPANEDESDEAYGEDEKADEDYSERVIERHNKD